MISRHLFRYSAAYLLSGDKDYINIADSTVRRLLDHARDREYGGWFDAPDKEGNPGADIQINIRAGLRCNMPCNVLFCNS